MSDNRTNAAVTKLSDALVQVNGYAYATGYLTSYLARLIEKHVPQKELTELRIELLGEACNVLLGGKK